MSALSPTMSLPGWSVAARHLDQIHPVKDSLCPTDVARMSTCTRWSRRGHDFMSASSRSAGRPPGTARRRVASLRLDADSACSRRGGGRPRRLGPPLR